MSDLPAVQRELTPEQIDLVKRTLMPAGSSDDELALFIQTCNRTGLDPFARQIYAVKRRQKVRGEWVDRLQILTAIDGFRTLADRTGDYDGQEGPFFCGEDGEWKDVWLDRNPPAAAKVVVHRKSAAHPWSAVALWREYVPIGNDGQPSFMWQKMSAFMLGKVAESLALRKAFTQLSGLYTGEEMEQAGVAVPENVNVETGEILEGKVVSLDSPELELERKRELEAEVELPITKLVETGEVIEPEPEPPKPKAKSKGTRKKEPVVPDEEPVEATVDGDPTVTEAPVEDTIAFEEEPESQVSVEPETKPAIPDEPKPKSPKYITQVRERITALQDTFYEWNEPNVLRNASSAFARKIETLDELTKEEAERILEISQPYLRQVQGG